MTLLILASMTSIILAIFFSGYALGVRNTDEFYLATVDEEETPIFNQLKEEQPELYLFLITPIGAAA